MKSQIRAGLLQARADGRVTFLTPAFLGVIIGPIAMVLAFSYLTKGVEYDAAIGQVGSFGLAGLIGAAGALAAFNVLSEMQTERTAGTLLRIRMLPHGVVAWCFGKLLVSFVYLLVTGGLALFGAMMTIPGLRPEHPAAYVLIFLLLILSFIVFFPLGVIGGALIRSTWGLIASMGVFMLLYAGSGTALPLTLYPDWLQWLIGATPIYWTAHLGRWILLPAQAGAGELTGSFEPLIGVLVVIVWIVLGFAVAPRVMRSGMSRETVGSLMASRERVATKGYA